MKKPIIIANGTTLTCDATNRCGRYNILIIDGRIADVTERYDSLVRDHPNATIVDATDKLIVPGFVNAHYHGASFLLREATKRLHYSLWSNDERLEQALMKLLHSSSYEDIQRTYLAAYLAHVQSGTTCVGEFPPALDDVAFAEMIEGVNTIGVSARVSLQNWDQIRKAALPGDKRAQFAVSLGEEKDFTVFSFEHLSKAAKQMNAPLLAHIAETKDGVEAVRQHFQRDCITLLNSYNLLQSNIILVHANYLNEEEVAMIKNVEGTVIVCPRSTAQKQTGYPALRHLAKYAVRLVLGTDWGTTNMIDEMRFMFQLPLVVAGFRPFAATEILHMATMNGAHALGLANELGSIEINKRADMVLLDVADIRLPIVQGASTEEWANLLIAHLSSADISDVMIGGTFKVRERAVVNLPENAIEEGFRGLHRKFFPPGSSTRLETPQPPTEQKVLTFLSETRIPTTEAEGFEEGFSVIPKSAPILEMTERPVEANPLLNLPKVTRAPIKPELPKNTRRVFGEDDEV